MDRGREWSRGRRVAGEEGLMGEFALDHEMYCRDCRSVWSLEYEDDGNTIANASDRECVECRSSDVARLNVVQREAADEEAARERGAEMAYDSYVESLREVS